jgi:hypothetical protein
MLMARLFLSETATIMRLVGSPLLIARPVTVS